MARGAIIRRCRECRASGQKEMTRCGHKEAVYHIRYRIGVKQFSKLVGPNKKDAERRLAEIISEINNGTYFKPSTALFKMFAMDWLRDYASCAVKPSTLRSYRSVILTYLIPAFGDQPISHIREEMIQKLVADMKRDENRSAKTINNILVLMKTMFKNAKQRKLIRESPVDNIKRLRTSDKEMDFLRPEEIESVLKCADEPYRTLFMTAIFTGMRRGEIVGLQWGDIDWKSNFIHVRRSLYWLGRKEMEERHTNQRWQLIPPKTSYSKRRIIMSPKLKKALQIHRIESPANPFDLVFCNTLGNPMDPDNMVDRQFYPTLVRADIRKIRFHDLRHTFATLLIAQNGNIKFIQSQLGHASIQTTLDRYGHLLPMMSDGVADKLDQMVFGEIAKEDFRPVPAQAQNLS